MNLQSTALLWAADGRAATVVEVVAAKGSVPRAAGTRMLVGEREVIGTIGGGHLEWKAIRHARALLRDAGLDREQHWALGPSLGQCCGGALTLRYTPLADVRSWPLPARRFTLQLHGAGHVGRAIVRLLDGIACRVQWVDERDDQFPAEPGAAHVERICVDAPEAEVAAAAPGTFFLVLTHDHDLDLRITHAVLRRGDFGWLGLIGSQTKRARFVRRLADRGIAADVLARLTCPIGLPGIAGKEPEVIAVAVVAQLLLCAGSAVNVRAAADADHDARHGRVPDVGNGPMVADAMAPARP